MEMKERVGYKDFFVPFLLGLGMALLSSTVTLGLYVHYGEDTLPESITSIILPALTAFFAGYFIIPRIRNHVIFRYSGVVGRFDIHNMFLYTLLVSCTIILFQPLRKSIRYNVGKVMYLNSIDEMPPYEQPQFLELGEWHIDRMRVIPINTYERGKLFNRQKIYLKSLYLVPIFSKTTAYRTTAKGWLAFKYEKAIPDKEFEQNKGQPHFEGFVKHFKRINVGAFLYFERYPAGNERQMLTTLAKAHSYFQSGYINIYEGRSIDRDFISMQYAIVFLLILILGIIPAILLTSRFLLLPTQEEH